MVFSFTCSKGKVLFVGVRRKCLKVILSTILILSANFGPISVKKILNWFAISVLLYIFSPSRAMYSNVDFLLVDLFKIEFTAFHVI